MSKIKIVIVDDDKDLRVLLRKIVSEQDDMEVVKVFPSAKPYADEFKTLDVDVVIMDINMPGKTGIECVADCKPLKPQIQYLISTVFDNPENIFSALKSGATGYILKNSRPEELVNAIREINSGGSPMSTSIARLVVGSFTGDKPASQKNPVAELSHREREIAELIAKGFIYKEIAEKLFLSPDTVRTHIRNIYEKLQVNSKMEMVNKVFNRQ
ncbi:MAG: response regulator transcription factor [Bacteroidetes bacterium]|nr:response regulator transcription factor [Bacteroidota bacterium]